MLNLLKCGIDLISSEDPIKNYFLRYFVIGIIFWLIVEWTTVFNPDYQRWLSYMPEIWLIYVGYPLLFAFLIYRKKLSNTNIFIATLVGAFIVEVVFTGNELLYTFPIMLIGMPFAISIYSFITFGVIRKVSNPRSTSLAIVLGASLV